MSAVPTSQSRATIVLDEVGKIGAFLRRDLVIAWSYRMSFVTDWLGLAIQVVLFYFVGRMVDPSTLPSYAGTQATYLEFAAIGIAITALIALALARVAVGIRAEQMTGTLESLLMTPTSPTTIQVGTVMYDLLYIPIRTGAFLLITAVAFGLGFHLDGVLPALTVLLAFIPFVWGLGVANAGLVLTFRRGGNIATFGGTVLTLLSGALFPLTLFPGWVQTVAAANPVAITLDGMREPLIGGTGWSDTPTQVLQLLPFGISSLVLGIVVFKLALRRERRRGSLGLY